MIKSTIQLHQASDDLLLQSFNQYLKILKAKLSLSNEAISHTASSDNLKQTSYLNEYQQIKKKEVLLLDTLQHIRLVNIPDKRTFDRFCLRLYQLFENFVMGLKRNKIPYIDVGTLLPKIQIVFSQHRSDQEIIQIGDFLLKIAEIQEHFILNNLKKIKNELKDTNLEFFNKLQSLLKAKPKIHDDSINSYILKAQPQLFSVKLRHTSLKIANEIPQRTIRVQRNSPKSQDRKQFRQIRCRHCSSVNIMEVSNLNDVYHNKYNKQYSVIMHQLLQINQQIKKDINNYLKKRNKKKKLKILKEKMQKTYKKYSFYIDEEKETKFNIQKKQEKIEKSKETRIQTVEISSFGKGQMKFLSRISRFEKGSSKSKENSLMEDGFVDDVQRLRKTLFPKLKI